MRPAIVFHTTNRNWYSYVPLVNSIEQSDFEGKVFLSKDVISRIGRLIPDFKPVICCMSFMTTEFLETMSLVRDIRKEFGHEAKLLAGGPHATGSPEKVLEIGFDAVVRGEGEIIFPGVLNALCGEKRPGSWPIVRGEPIDSLDRYPPVSFKHALYPPLEISRGCLFKCRYCSVPKCCGPLRHRSVGSVLEAARRLVELRDRWDFRFISPNSLGYGSMNGNPNVSRVQELLESLRNLPGRKRIFFSTFPSEARPDFVTPETADLISRLADNERVSIGGQSGSDDILRKMRRGHKVRDIRSAVDILLDAGLVPCVDLMFGFPGETESDQLETVGLISELVDRGCEIRIHHFMPLSGSSMAGEQPAPISSEVMGNIGDLTRRGKAKGAFSRQMSLAREISNLS